MFLEMKAQRDEEGPGILLGDNTGGGSVMLPLIRFGLLDFWFQLDSHVQYMVYV
jgi:hypothetical protein